MRSIHAAVGASVLIVGFLTLAPATAGAAPSGIGCPAAWTLQSVASLAATGHAPNPGLVDAAGNGDGYVCTFPLPDEACIPFIVQLGLDRCPVDQLYLYSDNNIPR
jgi:hypothetical protein